MAKGSVRLGDVVSVKHGYAFSGEGFSDDPGHPTLVTPGNFAIGGGFRRSKPKTFAGNYPKEFELSRGDLIITMTDLSRDGATLGLPAIVPDDGTFLHNQRIGLVQVRDESAIDDRFLNYFLRTAAYRSYILGTASGSTVRHTSPGRIEDFVAPLPEVGEQRAIAEVLGALDDRIAANDRATGLARELSFAVFRSAARDGLRVQLAEVVELLTRGVAPTYTEDGSGMLVLNQKCVRNSNVSLEQGRRMVPLTSRLERILRMNDVLVNSTGQGTLGRTARWVRSESVTVDSHITIVRFDEKLVDATCAGMALVLMQREIELLAEGSTGQTELKRDVLGSIELRLPFRERQLEVGRKISELSALGPRLDDETKRLMATRDELLPLLMSGKVRVKDSEKVVEEAV